MVAQEDQTRRRVSVEEWRALLERGEVRYEYHHGWLVAMAGRSGAHAQIGGNVYTALAAALEGTACVVYTSDMAVRLSPTEYRFPGATVSCDERDRPTRALREVHSPRVIVEVLSDSTEPEDRIGNYALYTACPCVQE